MTKIYLVTEECDCDGSGGYDIPVKAFSKREWADRYTAAFGRRYSVQEWDLDEICIQEGFVYWRIKIDMSNWKLKSIDRETAEYAIGEGIRGGRKWVGNVCTDYQELELREWAKTEEDAAVSAFIRASEYMRTGTIPPRGEAHLENANSDPVESSFRRILHFATGGCDMPLATRLKCIARECESTLQLHSETV